MNPQSLPSLRNFDTHSLTLIAAALASLHALYWPISCSHSPVHFSKRPPDSGYASAEDEDVAENDFQEQKQQVEVPRVEAVERTFIVRWLTALITRSNEWTDHSGDVQERENRVRIMEEAIMLLALYADTGTDDTLVRRFAFPVHCGEVVVELQDEPVDAGTHDHESVGLQTWGSACVLAEKICADPSAFGLTSANRVRVLELGAGTGLLSMVVAKLCENVDLVATDFHPVVLENLRSNVARNRLGNAVRVEELHWARPPTLMEVDKYDIILAADVIYDIRHGAWIKHCAERSLRRGGVLWMIIPGRPTREGEISGVHDVFTTGKGLKILSVEDVAKRRGIGRADETGYRVFKIVWESCS